MRRTVYLGLLFLLAMAGSALADDYGRRVRVDWDSRGWQMLGERTVDGRVDRDRIDVGRYEGRFSKLTVVVHDSDVELLDFTINFADRTTYSPRTAHYFREGQRTRVFDLPGSYGSVIRNIDVKYRNLPGGGRARIQVWGFKVADAPVRPVRVEWDSRGWVLLGEREINGRVDHDRIEVGRSEGKFSRLTLVALDSDMEILDFEVKFGRGAPWHPTLNHYFREGQRTHAIAFPGDREDRSIKYIDFKYRNLPGGGRAKLQVWGFKTQDAGGGYDSRRNVWDDRGWTLLGERTVDGRVDRDRIDVGRDEGKFSKLMVVVLDSDLELLDFDVKLNRGEHWNPGVRQYFRENTRTRSIDLPGDRRTIKYIDIKYRNLAGGGRARFQVWGR